VSNDRKDFQGEFAAMLASRNVVVSIRRNYIYEDAFDKLSQENGIYAYCIT